MLRETKSWLYLLAILGALVLATAILARCTQTQRQQARTEKVAAKSLAHPFSVITGYWDGEGWRNERSAAGHHFPATHWMPLPAAPTGDARNGMGEG